MGLSRRTTTRPQHHLTYLSPHDENDDPRNLQPSQSAATSRRRSFIGSGVLSKLCVLLLTATAGIRSYSVLHMSLSSYKNARTRRSVVLDPTLDDARKHVMSKIHCLSGNNTLVASKRIKKVDDDESSSPASSTAAASMTTTNTVIPRRLIFTHKSNLLEETKAAAAAAAAGEQTKRLSMQDVRFQQNVLNTIEQYQLAWNAIDTAAASTTNNINTNNSSNSHHDNANYNVPVQVWFLDNDDCEAAIQRVEPELVPHFQDEARGDYKADLCRIAALYLHGGYYFDVDMRVITPIIFENNGEENDTTSSNVTFSTAIMAARDGFFQSFLASTASNRILQESLRIMLEWYKNKAVLRAITEEKLLFDKKPSGTDNVAESVEISNSIHEIDPALLVISRRGLIGPVSLKFAYERVMVNSNNNSSSVQEGGGGNHQKAYILQEDDLSANPNRELFPGLVRQEGNGCCCNYVVHGPASSFILSSSSSAGEQGQNPKNTNATTTLYFFSRIVGAGEYCHGKGGVGTWVRPRQQTKQSPTYKLFKQF